MFDPVYAGQRGPYSPGQWAYKQMIGESYGEYGSDGLCYPGPSGRFEPSQVGLSAR